MEKELLRSNKARRITLIGFWINAILTSFKIFAGIFGKSTAMIADGIHSLSDFLTDIVVMIGFKITEKPEDECHNYGHDKYETLATLIISGFLFFIGFNILKSGILNIYRVISGKTIPTPGQIALLAAGLSIVVKEFLFRYTIKAGKKLNSSAIIANAWHHRSDSFSSIGTLIGIGGAIVLGEQWNILDPIASVFVSIFIFKIAIEIFLPATHELMEASLNDKEIEEIKDLIIRNNEIMDFHKLRTRKIGTKSAIEFHMLVKETMDITTAHDISSQIEKDIKQIFGESSIVTIHIEPYIEIVTE